MRTLLLGLAIALTSACYNPSFSTNPDGGDGPGAFRCARTDSPRCPSGLSCCVGRMCDDNLPDNTLGWCVVPPVPIDLTTMPIDFWDFGLKPMYYTGTMMDPMLTGKDPDTGMWRCHRDDTNPNKDASILRMFEPNDLPSQAINLGSTLPSDLPPTMMGSSYEICPDHTAPNVPDVDAFSFKLKAPAKVIIEIKYKVALGDLDVALFQDSTNPDMPKPQFIRADLTAVDNACIPANNLMAGKYYVVVRGVHYPELPTGVYTMNTYQIRVFIVTTNYTCAGARDGGP